MGTLAAVNLYARITRRFAKTRGMRWTMSKVLTPLDLRLKGTRLAPSSFGGRDVPLCYLTTVGRRSGNPRTVPLLFAPVNDGSVAVVATNFGGERHPAWAHNLEANPEATLEVDGVDRDVIARRASDHEVATTWRQLDRVWPGYEKYREIAPRDVKVFVLDSA